MLPRSSSIRTLRSRGSTVIGGLVVTTGTGCTGQQTGGIHGRQPYSRARQPRCHDDSSLHGAGLVHGRCNRRSGCRLPHGKIPGHGYSLYLGGLHGLDSRRRSGCRRCPGPGSGAGDRRAPGGCQAADDKDGRKKAQAGSILHHTILPIWTVMLSSCPAMVPSEAERSGGRSALCSRSR